VLGPLLALGSSLSGGAADFLGGTTSRRIGTTQFMFCTQVGGLTLAACLVAVTGKPVPDLAALATAAAAGVGLVIGIGAFFQAMVVGTVSIVAPISAIGVIVPVAAGLAEGERLRALQVLGIVAVLLGTALAAREPTRRRRVAPGGSGLGLALLAALGGGVCLWLVAPASHSGGVAWTLLVVRAITVSTMTGVLFARRASLRSAFTPRIAVRMLAFVVLGFLGFTLYALATVHGSLAIVSVLASLYPAVPVLLAHRLLGERLHRAQRIGVATVLLGVAMLSS
jgi:drug/metabolite transporter (DMT)-like permease